MTLWHNFEFRKLWLANTVSSLGTQITLLALPLTAITLMDASSGQMGILAACGTSPYLLLGLPAGVWVDRLRRRPILIAADVGRAVLLGLIPLLAMLECLRIEHLYILAFLTGILSLLYDITEEAYLPAIIEHEHLVEGNSQLAAIDATAELISPVVAGGLVQWLTAPIAIAVDAVSFLWSAFWLSRIRRQEPQPVFVRRGGLWSEIREGIVYLLRNPLLRPSVLTGIQWQLFGGMTDALLVLYLTQSLHLLPTAIGMVYTISSVSALAITSLSSKVLKRFGPGPTAIGAAAALGIGWLFIPLADGAPAMLFATLAAGMLLAGAGNTLWNVTTTSVTQTITPDRLLGRVNASGGFLTSGALPLGSLLGGWVAEQWGVRPTLLLACSGVFLGILWVWFSPLRTLYHFPNSASSNITTTDDEEKGATDERLFCD